LEHKSKICVLHQDKGKQKTKFNEYDPAIMLPTTSYLPPPAYNPEMTQQAEPQKMYTVSHQAGKFFNFC
jgi:hypothetical protein